MLDHVSLNVRDLAASRRFYEEALRPLGYAVAFEGDTHVGFTDGKGYDLFLHVRDDPSTPVHVAFRAADRATVAEFHRAALAAGAQDNGAPGPRPQYHREYYGAFALDPDGNNVEAVCHKEGAE